MQRKLIIEEFHQEELLMVVGQKLMFIPSAQLVQNRMLHAVQFPSSVDVKV